MPLKCCTTMPLSSNLKFDQIGGRNKRHAVVEVAAVFGYSGVIVALVVVVVVVVVVV